MTVPEARQDARLRRYELRSLRFPVGARCVAAVVPAAREWLRDGAWRGRAAPDEPPYWVEIWPAARAAVWALARHPGLGGLRVLDLGCGLGLPGIAAASLGAEVTLWDREPDALAFAAWNARAVGGGRPVETWQRDFAAAAPAARFDVVAMADVSYRVDQHEHLLRLVSAMLAPGGVVLHADPGRPESARFLRRLAAVAPVAAEVTRKVPHRGAMTAVRVVVAGCGGALQRSWAARLGAARDAAGTGSA